MKSIILSVLLFTCSSFFYGTPSVNFIDKSHVKNHAENWIDIWCNSKSPLSNLRFKECIDSILWSEKTLHNDDFYCISYMYDQLLIFVETDTNTRQLFITGLLESPENDYYTGQIDDINDDLLLLCNLTNFKLNYSKLKIWSHGYYLKKYQDSENDC